MDFKALMYSLSGVPPERQKIMMKGGVLGNDGWGKIKLVNGANVMMMGSADALPEAPVEKTKFVEDMDDGEIARAMELPQGLSNLGNTCYMNATLQCLHAIPELRSALKEMERSPSVTSMGPEAIVSCMQSLFSSMDNSATPIFPFVFLQMLHTVFPQFATKGEGGKWMQQDANECYTELVRCLQQRLPLPSTQRPTDSSNNIATASQKWIDIYLRGEQECVLKNSEDENEEPSTSTESFLQLSCFIDSETKYIHTGIRNGLEGTLTKLSPSLERDAVYKKSASLSRLPAYLSIQFVRFYYKEKAGINAKVLRDVKFQMVLDVFEFCTEPLKRRLLPIREKFKEMDERQLEEERQKKVKNSQAPKLEELATKEPEKKSNYAPYYFSDDIGSNNSGYYDLVAVLTHQGRSSNTGHYVAWVRKKEDAWVKFDDDKVSEVTSEEVLRLSGGGDWHMAYVLIYGPRRLELPEAEAMDTAPPPTAS